MEDFNRTFSAPSAPPSPEQEQYIPCTAGAISGCIPDTFYSWGPEQKLSSIRENSPHSREWIGTLNGDRHLYMSISSVATFCYGRLPVRFRYRGTFNEPQRGALNTGFGTPGTLLEWIIHYAEFPATLESISYGQSDHFDEIVIEIQRRLNPNASWHTGWLYYTHPASQRGVNVAALKQSLLGGCLPERFPATEEVLVENLILFLEAIFSHQGWLHTRGDLPIQPSPHFSTHWRTFFNPE